MTKKKVQMLIVAALMTIAGCSASYKGDIKGSNNPDASKSGTYVESSAQPAVGVGK